MSDDPSKNFIYCKEFDIEKLSCERQKGNRIPLEYDGCECRIHLPILLIPYSIQDKKTSDGRVFMKSLSFSMDFVTESKSNQKHIVAFRKMIEQIDLFVENKLEHNEQFYNSLYSGKSCTTFSGSIKFEYGTKDVKLDLFNDKREVVEFDNGIFKEKMVTGIIKLDSIWISRGKAGINWIIETLQICGDYNPPPPKQAFMISTSEVKEIKAKEVPKKVKKECIITVDSKNSYIEPCDIYMIGRCNKMYPDISITESTSDYVDSSFDIRKYYKDVVGKYLGEDVEINIENYR